MNDQTNEILAKELERRREALKTLSVGAGVLLKTSDALKLLPMPISEDTLLDYPTWVLPRVPVNPAAKRLTYLYDPSDLLDLRYVLVGWERARAQGQEAEEAFRAARIAQIHERERTALTRPGEAA